MSVSGGMAHVLLTSTAGRYAYGKRRIRMRNILLPAMMAFLFTLGTVSCEQEGSFEDTGEELDEAAEEAGDRVEKATE